MHAILRGTVPETPVPRPYPDFALNEPIALYEGSIELAGGGSVLRRGPGRVHLEWLPSLRIAYELDGLPRGDPIYTGEVILRLPDLDPVAEAPATINRVLVGTGLVSGVLSGPLVVGRSDPVSAVRFQVPNTRGWLGGGLTDGRSVWAGRTALEGGPWRVTLDARVDEKDAVDELKSRGGYRFTYVGQIERIDAGLMTLDESRGALAGVHHFLALARGFWTPPLLPVGFDTTGREVWRELASAHATPWRATESWFAHQKPDALVEAFPGFVQRWLDPDWRQTLELAIVWFVEANAPTWAENSLVLSQAALELLSWVVIVEELKRETRASFKKKRAHQRIRDLLLWAQLPTSVPAELADVQTFAPGKDGPGSLALLRNAIVHGDRARIFASDLGARIQLRTLALWYLELVLLRLFNFNGDYLSRIESGAVWDVKPVPWATRTDLESQFARPHAEEEEKGES